MLGEVFDFAKESPAILEDSQQMAPRVSENDIAFFFSLHVCIWIHNTALWIQINFQYADSLSLDDWPAKECEQWTDGDEADDEVKMMMSVWLCEIGA